MMAFRTGISVAKQRGYKVHQVIALLSDCRNPKVPVAIIALGPRTMQGGPHNTTVWEGVGVPGKHVSR